MARRLELLLDEVDEADHVVGTIPRADALTRGANFRVAHVFVFDPAGRLLLQRIGPEHPRSPGLWGSSAAGYLASGEDYAACAGRKLREELGVRAPLDLIGKTPMRDGPSLKFIALFRAAHAGPFRPEPGHVGDVRFSEPAEIRAALATSPSLFTPTFHHVFGFWTHAAAHGRGP